MPIEANKELVRRYQEAHNTNDLDALNAIVAVDLIAHSLMPGLPPGLEGGKLAHQMAVSAFPDFHATIEDLIAEGDKVATRMIFRGTHTGGEFMGIQPSGRAFAFSATAIFRIAGGKIVEHWGDEDALGWLQQLGAMPAPG
jgi:predicted ester cyclase